MDAARVRVQIEGMRPGPPLRPENARLVMGAMEAIGMTAAIIDDGERRVAIFPLSMVAAPPDVIARASAEADAADLEKAGQAGVPVSDAGLAAAHAVESPPQPQTGDLRAFLGICADLDGPE